MTHRHVVIITLAAAFFACGGETPELSTATESNSQELTGIGLFSYDIGNATGSPVRTGNTCGAANEWTPSCTGSTAADNTFIWRAPYTGSFNINTFVPWFTTSYDSVLHVYDYWSGALLGCNDDSSGTYQSSVTVNVTAGQQLKIVVDGWSSACGAYYLSISCSGANCPNWTAWTSEESQYPPINCGGNLLINRGACRGNYCDDIRAYCDLAPGTRTSTYVDWSTPTFSDENPYGTTCPGGWWLTGIKCEGSYCDNMRIKCSYQSGVTQANCGWNPSWFSDENGDVGQTLPAGYYAAGLRCNNSYCDNMDFYMCQMK